ncbi:hypothetical protein BaRGS_00016646 [Batillaria attramentaria]|uniref:Uncharacterized protein n=1 Tax=Batillaria attramentaria TaxID=370345 RepID=A0ABD0KYF7_9CAEN
MFTESHTTESLRSSIDVLSLSIGSCVTLVLTVLVVVVIWLCRRQRGHAYPDLANAPYRLRLPVDIDEFFWNRIPAVVSYLSFRAKKRSGQKTETPCYIQWQTHKDRFQIRITDNRRRPRLKDPPAPHTFGQEAVHVSSPYEEVS